MNGIYHKIGIRAEPHEVMQALTTADGLAGWWTDLVRGDFAGGAYRPGDVIRLDFVPGGFDLKVCELSPEHLVWEMLSGPEEWIGTHVDFQLKSTQGPDGSGMTLVYFRHQDWKRENEFVAHCSMKWATFLLSLRDWLEHGYGQPAPFDLRIDELH